MRQRPYHKIRIKGPYCNGGNELEHIYSYQRKHLFKGFSYLLSTSLPEVGLEDLDYIMVDTKQTKMLLLMKMLLYITTEGCVLESNRLRPPHLSSYIFQHLIVFETDKCSDLNVDSVFCIILKLTIDPLISNCCYNHSQDFGGRVDALGMHEWPKRQLYIFSIGERRRE